MVTGECWHGQHHGTCPTTCTCNCHQDTTDDVDTFIVYGMAEAMKYGEIVFPTFHSYESYDD